MSEEIIEKMDKDLRFLEGFIDDSTTSITVDIQLIKDFRKLLDLYNKQKEELEDYKSGYFFTAKQMHFIDEDYIAKDKIIDKIHEIGSETQYLLSDKGETKQNYAIRKLKELLEEK